MLDETLHAHRERSEAYQWRACIFLFLKLSVCLSCRLDLRTSSSILRTRARADEPYTLQVAENEGGCAWPLLWGRVFESRSDCGTSKTV